MPDTLWQPIISGLAALLGAAVGAGSTVLVSKNALDHAARASRQQRAHEWDWQVWRDDREAVQEFLRSASSVTSHATYVNQLVDDESSDEKFAESIRDLAALENSMLVQCASLPSELLTESMAVLNALTDAAEAISDGRMDEASVVVYKTSVASFAKTARDWLASHRPAHEPV